ncbi:hypothetical protein BDR26DRAFT_636366 [Obelidium mucronatum]|nr:hypothetical protein BDR26DRAFT_636366 [Obelidium mucronatum]
MQSIDWRHSKSSLAESRVCGLVQQPVDGSHLCWIMELQIRIKLGENNFTGELPPLINGLNERPTLRLLELQHNQLYGCIPDFINFSMLIILNLSHNGFSGALPKLTGVSNLEVLDLSFNKLSGPIPAEWGHELRSLETLNLGSNFEIDGMIPAELGLIAGLGELDLSFNKLTGEIPDTLVKGHPWHKMEHLRLNNNQLTGSIPNEFATVAGHFFVFDLSHNKLTGTIPIEFGSHWKLEKFNLSSNELVGPIPQFGGCFNLEILDLSCNSLTGEIPNFHEMPRLEKLDLRCNNLSGKLPEFDESLVSFEFLVDNNPKLSGSIPASYSQLALSVDGTNVDEM